VPRQSKAGRLACQGHLTYGDRANILTLMRMLCGWSARMRRPAAAWGIATLVCEAAVTWMIAAEPALPKLLRQALVLAPRLTLLGFLGALVRMVTHMDELQKRISLESAFIAFVASLALVFVFTGLGEAGLWQPRWTLLTPAMMGVWVVGYAYSSWRYR
jgi:hypothetical protein